MTIALVLDLMIDEHQSFCSRHIPRKNIFLHQPAFGKANLIMEQSQL